MTSDDASTSVAARAPEPLVVGVLASRADADAIDRALLAADVPHALAAPVRLLLAAVLERADDGAQLVVRVRRLRRRLAIEVEAAGRLPGGRWPLETVADLATRWGLRLGDRTTLWIELDR